MHRVFIEKQTEFNSEAKELSHVLRENLNIAGLTAVRVIQRYDVDGLDDPEFARATQLILAEPQIAAVSGDLHLTESETEFAVEYLPGQFDQRADSAAQCVQILTAKKPLVASAKIIVLDGELSTDDISKVKTHCINTVDSREASMEVPTTLEQQIEVPADVAILDGMTTESDAELESRRTAMGLAMSAEDFRFTRDYFRDEESRDPSITEIKMLDTYWSDHCRHTTFATKFNEVVFDDGTDVIKNAYVRYQETREAVYGDNIATRPETLMDIALIAMKELRKTGELDNVEISEEINAASIEIDVEIEPCSDHLGHTSNLGAAANTTTERWLLMFKNETHNHPTEIEPFGGAATCLGGCIRDPLSGRSYVFQAMRVTGAADPNTPFDQTLEGKLPQRVICQGAADGYSSYGNQIGLATGQVSEIYHPNYVAKRMEIGAVVAAVPKANVFRGTPAPGDAILLIGGRTGRDGVGGATGSSKEHTDTALDNSAEVQKGNAPTERKIQRLFRNPELARKIKVCNDFGAGGVSVAIGEIAPSLDITLDNVPKKYDGLDGTELAISESQERMAVCVDPAEIDYFIAECDKENLECTHVAKVTDTGRLVINWRGKKIVDFSRAFLDTNGVTQTANIQVTAPTGNSPLGKPVAALQYNSSQTSKKFITSDNEQLDTKLTEGRSPAQKAIASHLARVHQASERAGIVPQNIHQRMQHNLALRAVEEQELRKLKEYQLDPAPFFHSWNEQGKIEGGEQKVCLNDDGIHVLKANDGGYHGHWLEYLDRLDLHRQLFPATAYDLLGFFWNNDTLYFLVRQPFFRAARDQNGVAIPASDSQVHQFLIEDLGAIHFRNRDYYLPSEDIFIEDLHEENVFLSEDGETLLFIDPVIFRRPADVKAPQPTLQQKFLTALSDLNSCAQKSLGEQFDSSVGAGTVLQPFGGKHQLTPIDAMVAKIPLVHGNTDTTSHMAWGFNPNIATWSPFHGALYAVTESVCKVVASGAHIDDIRLTLQEYFEKLGNDPTRWGKPFAALLGAFVAQNELRLGAIGGKDSMSGTFKDIDVPPTLVSFAVAPCNANLAVSPEFKQVGSELHLVTVPRDADGIPDFDTLKLQAALLYAANTEGKIDAIHSLAGGGIAVGISKMAFGNHLGAELRLDADQLFHERYFNWIVEVKPGESLPAELDSTFIGNTTAEPAIKVAGESIALDTLLAAWTSTLEDTYPSQAEVAHTELETFSYNGEAAPRKTKNQSLITNNTRPKIVIPVFPGTNSEYDSAKAFTEAGGEARQIVFRNLTSKHVEESLTALAKHIRESHILMIPGGFSAGDEPDGSGKFIATVLRSPQVSDAIMDLLQNRDGLVLGICNGFQALIKTGLVPYGEIRDPQAGAPTLTFNDIGRHIACYATTRIASTMSPWLANTEVGDLHTIPFSHGEGKFFASETQVKELAANGQIATQYTDLDGNPSMAIEHNPNGSVFAIEGITSPCGRVLGKMGHTERRGTNVAKNIPGNKHQPLFKAGVTYFL